MVKIQKYTEEYKNINNINYRFLDASIIVSIYKSDPTRPRVLIFIEYIKPKILSQFENLYGYISQCERQCKTKIERQ